uniref:Uncharacterized protein MANES_12G032400 n=1 Tax=Rhizophora mucronata TaxID=61149 RepID=A0A2P2KQ11_RHIMU
MITYTMDLLCLKLQLFQKETLVTTNLFVLVNEITKMYPYCYNNYRGGSHHFGLSYFHFRYM